MSEIRLIQANTENLNALVRDADGAPVDVSAASIQFQLWKRNAQAAAISLTEADPQVVGNADGTVVISLTAADTSIEIGTYQLELKVVGGDFAKSITTVAYVGDSQFYDGLNL